MKIQMKKIIIMKTPNNIVISEKDDIKNIENNKNQNEEIEEENENKIIQLTQNDEKKIMMKLEIKIMIIYL